MACPGSRQDDKESRTVSPLYIRNPDVVLREEDPDGGLLFNPDTNQIKVINHTGLFVWQLCDGKHGVPSMVTALQESFDGVPEEEAATQVAEYIDEMVTTGFIGIVED